MVCSPELHPLETVIAVPEPELPVTVPPRYICEHEVMHSEIPMLRYLVDIRIIKVQDWNPHLSSSSDDDPDDSDDSNDTDWFDAAAHRRSGPWP